jgi:hypothetical protein
MSSVITYLRLDAEYDPVFDNTATLSDLEAVRQAIQTRLALFQGEWWEDLNDGTPMFQEILGQRASQNGLQAMALVLNERIAGTPYVQGVQNVNIVFNAANRSFTYTATALTAFGSTDIVFPPPGASAEVTQ